MIVYIQEFDKYDNSGKLLCRNTKCSNHPLYCPIRNTVLKNVIGNLDDGIITISFGIVSGQTYLGVTDILARFVRRSFFSNIEESLLDRTNLECDHIIPRSLYQQLGYKYDTLENKIKVTIEFFHNHSNLRTVCRDCHKQVTSTFLSNKFKKDDRRVFLEENSL